jgi:flavin reductase (DIM6/NTAB) family NADH-FMN oxidoreductase RutF
MTSMLKTRLKTIVKKVVFGDSLLAQEFFIGLPDPQDEIALSLHGLNSPVDVTRRYSMACAAPFTVCIAFEEGQVPDRKFPDDLTLKFCERGRESRVLGEIGLKLMTTLTAGGMQLFLFEARKSINHCLPKIRLGAHYLFHAYSNKRVSGTTGMEMTFLERRAAMVNFIRPHPVVLASLLNEYGGNIFPMNIMGDLGSGHFAFALKDSRRAAHMVRRVGRIALSNLPMQQAPLAYQLAINHTRDFIDWNQLPFATKSSSVFQIPIPVFAQRVRELEVKLVHKIGSHIFFVAQVTSDETYSTDPGLCVIHGFYQAWRLRGRTAESQVAAVESSFNKTGIYRA